MKSQNHLHSSVTERKPETAICADQLFSNGLTFQSFSCCLLFCVRGNPIGGLRKSQTKCFQMMMSCWSKGEKSQKKVFNGLTLFEKRKKKRLFMLTSCWRAADCAVRQHYTPHLCSALSFPPAKLARDEWLQRKAIIAAWFQAINQRAVFKLAGAAEEERRSQFIRACSCSQINMEGAGAWTWRHTKLSWLPWRPWKCGMSWRKAFHTQALVWLIAL